MRDKRYEKIYKEIYSEHRRERKISEIEEIWKIVQYKGMRDKIQWIWEKNMSVDKRVNK